MLNMPSYVRNLPVAVKAPVMALFVALSLESCDKPTQTVPQAPTEQTAPVKIEDKAVKEEEKPAQKQETVKPVIDEGKEVIAKVKSDLDALGIEDQELLKELVATKMKIIKGKRDRIAKLRSDAEALGMDESAIAQEIAEIEEEIRKEKEE